MENIILNAYKNKKLIAIYSDSINPDSFSVGYILYVDKTSYVLYEFSPYGKFDGYSCNLIEDIIKIEEDSIYLNSIKLLIKYYNFKIKDIVIDESKPILFGFLEFNKLSKNICSILCSNSDIFEPVGFVKKINKRNIELLQIDEEGRIDGLVNINLDNIERIVCKSNAEVKLEILYKLINNTIV